MGRTFTWNARTAREARKRLRLRQEDVADLVGVERKAIIRWEGDGEPSVTSAASLAAALGISLDSLVTSVIEEERATPTDRRGKPTRDDDPTAKPSVVPTHGGV